MTDLPRPQTDDEALSALLDDALDEETARTLQARLAKESALAARLHALRDANLRVRQAYAGVASEPLPEAVLDRLRPPASPDNILPYPGRASNVSTPLPVPLAAAAGIILVLGLSLGWFAGSRSSGGDALLASAGAIAPGNELHSLLESTPSGLAQELDDGATGTARLTYLSNTGRYCREIAVSATEGRTDALACRGPGAVWHIELVEFAPADSSLYRPATGSGSAIETKVDESIAGAPLQADEERALIEQGWDR